MEKIQWRIGIKLSWRRLSRQRVSDISRTSLLILKRICMESSQLLNALWELLLQREIFIGAVEEDGEAKKQKMIKSSKPEEERIREEGDNRDLGLFLSSEDNVAGSNAANEGEDALDDDNTGYIDHYMKI
ncbi:hypothetical protein Ccrd_026766, partial [Cynara cardunculus var. scolymus]